MCLCRRNTKGRGRWLWRARQLSCWRPKAVSQVVCGGEDPAMPEIFHWKSLGEMSLISSRCHPVGCWRLLVDQHTRTVSSDTHPAGSLQSALMAVLTPQKWANAANQGSPRHSRAQLLNAYQHTIGCSLWSSYFVGLKKNRVEHWPCDLAQTSTMILEQWADKRQTESCKSVYPL